uniref:complement C1q-like protein 2 n=1 Tax=Scatophagus argus TaxID=75038 RepID=UPI001ED820E8|nr:complement C1q-like protein 2 [Scatophagus argus]
MESFFVMMTVCLLTGLSQGEDSQIQITEVVQEAQADSYIEKPETQNLNQEPETPVILTTNSTGAHPSCEPPIFTVLKELGALKERLAGTVRALEETNKKLEDNEKKLSALNSKVAELSTANQGRLQVAFSAAFPTDDTIGPVSVLYPLVYRNVLFNTGGHYNPNTGYFTAPVEGVYYFTLNSFCWGASSGSCGGSLYKNGNKIVSWYEYDQTNPSSASNSAVLQLQVGDSINVCLWENRRISDNGNMYSSFSGFLLFPV